MWHVLGAREVHCRVLVGKPEGKGLFSRPRHKWESNIKMDLQAKGWRIVTVEDNGKWRDVGNEVMYHGVAGNFLTH
jgi:hypothetical protein